MCRYPEIMVGTLFVDPSGFLREIGTDGRARRVNVKSKRSTREEATQKEASRSWCNGVRYEPTDSHKWNILRHDTVIGNVWDDECVFHATMANGSFAGYHTSLRLATRAILRASNLLVLKRKGTNNE